MVRCESRGRSSVVCRPAAGKPKMNNLPSHAERVRASVLELEDRPGGPISRRSHSVARTDRRGARTPVLVRRRVNRFLNTRRATKADGAWAGDRRPPAPDLDAALAWARKAARATTLRRGRDVRPSRRSQTRRRLSGWVERAVGYARSGKRWIRIDEVITREIRRYVSRDWAAARASKDAFWATRIAQLGPIEGLRIADELRRQVVRQNPGWPTDEDRQDDLAAHTRLSELLRRASRPRSR